MIFLRGFNRDNRGNRRSGKKKGRVMIQLWANRGQSPGLRSDNLIMRARGPAIIYMALLLLADDWDWGLGSGLCGINYNEGERIFLVFLSGPL